MECFTVTVWTRAVHKPVVQFSHEFCLLGHLSHSGDLLLWVGVRRRASSVTSCPSFVVRRALTSSPQKRLGQS